MVIPDSSEHLAEPVTDFNHLEPPQVEQPLAINPAAPANDNEPSITIRVFNHKHDLPIILTAIIIPLFYIYYWSVAWREDLNIIDDFDQVYAHLEGTWFAILIVLVCFGLIGYACALRSRLVAPNQSENLFILGVFASACLLFSMAIAYDNPLWLFLLSATPMACLILSQYVPRSRPAVVLIGLTAFFLIIIDPDIFYSGGFYYKILEITNWSHEWSEWRQDTAVIAQLIEPLFYLCAYAPAFISPRTTEPPVSRTKTSVVYGTFTERFQTFTGELNELRESRGYITLGEAAKSVLPAIGLIGAGVLLGGLLMLSEGCGIWAGVFVISACILIAQFKLLADAINRGIRAANREDGPPF